MRVKKAKGHDAAANLQPREAYVHLGDAAVTLAEQQAEVAGGTLSASQKADIFRGTLEKLIAKLGPKDPLRKQLQGYIDQLNAIPSAKNTNITTSGIQPGNHGNHQAFAGGGIVGGASSEHPVMAKSGEGVFTPEQMAALPSVVGGGNGGETHYHFHNHGTLVTDGPSLDRPANMILNRAHYAPGR